MLGWWLHVLAAFLRDSGSTPSIYRCLMSVASVLVDLTPSSEICWHCISHGTHRYIQGKYSKIIFEEAWVEISCLLLLEIKQTPRPVNHWTITFSMWTRTHVQLHCRLSFWSPHSEEWVRLCGKVDGQAARHVGMKHACMNTDTHRNTHRHKDTQTDRHTHTP